MLEKRIYPGKKENEELDGGNESKKIPVTSRVELNCN